MKSGILFPVGAGGRNVDIDVETIQRMLNNVPMLIGPPSPLLKDDGDCGPLTIAAIKRFQRRAEFTVQDGRIDPGKTTHKRLAFLTEQVTELPDRLELGLKLAPLVITMVNSCRVILNRMVSELNNFKPPLKGPEADRARSALNTHFSLNDVQQNDSAVVGRIAHHLNGIGVLIESRPLRWREATMKQSKIESKRPMGDSVPSILLRPSTRDAVFTPNFKQFDQRDRMGWGPQSLAYELIKGAACVELDMEGDDFFYESDTAGYPGESVDEATHRSPGSYGAFVMEMRLRRAQPFGRKFRQL
jgi:hypothetical protein